MVFDFMFSSNKESINQLREQLQVLTNELNRTTEQLQLLEIEKKDSSSYTPQDDRINEEMVRELVQRQNMLSHEIIRTRKEIRKRSSKIILISELFVLPAVFLLLISILHIL